MAVEDSFPMARKPASPNSADQTLYDRIREDILRLALRPGQDLDEVGLAERYGVSRTPVREALIRLSADRLVTFSRNRGARVTPLILPDFPRFLEAVDLLRRALFRLAASRRHDADLAGVRKCFEALAALAELADLGDDRRAGELAGCEKDLLMRIAEAGHNGYLYERFESLLTQGLRMMRLPFAYNPPAGQSVADYLNQLLGVHRALVAALEARDPDAAERQGAVLHRALVLRLREYNEENLVTGVSVLVELAAEK